MKIKITRNILKEDNKIKEFFAVAPSNKILSDDYRMISIFIDLFIFKNSISGEFELIETHGNFFERGYYYNINNKLYIFL